MEDRRPVTAGLVTGPVGRGCAWMKDWSTASGDGAGSALVRNPLHTDAEFFEVPCGVLFLIDRPRETGNAKRVGYGTSKALKWGLLFIGASSRGT